MVTEHGMGPGSRILQQRRNDVVVLRPLGALDASLADDLRERALEAHAPVVIDLNGCEHLDASVIGKIVSAWVLYRPEMCFVCGLAGDREMIASVGEAHSTAVFPTLE